MVPTRHASLWWNGVLGRFLDPLNDTAIEQHVLTYLHKSSSLLNPVVGMRFDPANPKITTGAVDPNDYEGTINCFDGVKGYDGQFVPYGTLSAALDSSTLAIFLPDADAYFDNSNSTGPVPRPIGPVTDPTMVEYNCTGSSSPLPNSPYVALTATINGVDYQIDSIGNLLRPQSPSSSIGFCLVGIMNRSDTLQPDVVLGLPFLRSVYVAYRFPTDDCPGYYGFAFPAGSNRTQAQITQTPVTTPTKSAQCLSLIAPTSTPTANIVLAQEALAGKQTYPVYGQSGANQVHLVGVEDMPQIVWNWTALAT